MVRQILDRRRGQRGCGGVQIQRNNISGSDIDDFCRFFFLTHSYTEREKLHALILL